MREFGRIFTKGGAGILSPSTIMSEEMRQRQRELEEQRMERWRTRGCDCVITTNNRNTPQLEGDKRREKEEKCDGTENQ